MYYIKHRSFSSGRQINGMATFHVRGNLDFHLLCWLIEIISASNIARYFYLLCERLGLGQILSAVYLENIAWDEIEKLFTPICISQVLLAYQLAWLRPLDL